MTSIVGDQWHQIDRLQHIRKGLFSITNPNPDIILVLKMAKPMRSVESEKFYLKPVLAKSKDIEKMKKETKELDPTEYMQPFAWAYHHIFDDEGSILSPDVMVTELRHLRVCFLFFFNFLFHHFILLTRETHVLTFCSYLFLMKISLKQWKKKKKKKKNLNLFVDKLIYHFFC